MIDYNTIDIENTINSGQVFLWKKYENNWYGINGQDILEVSDCGKINSLSKKKIDFFRNKDDIKEILKYISKDDISKQAVKNYLGLRLLNQDPFQCLISFIVSSNSNIPKIKFTLENICRKFGKKVTFKQKEFFLFPEHKILASATIKEIQDCGAGYRSKYIISASKMVDSGEINFEILKNLPYNEAKKNILKIPGVGNKVADCILLFSLDKTEAFPLDRWMVRILKKYYSKTFNLPTKTLTDKQYDILHEKFTRYFGKYSGYAQQFLFKMGRENSQKKWL